MEINAINGVNGTSPITEVKREVASQTTNGNKAVNEGSEAVTQGKNQELSVYQMKGSDDMLKDAITEANNRLKFGNNDCEFMFHKEINRTSIKVINRNTQEVIKEIPSEATLEMIKKLKEMTGLLIDEKW